MTELTDTLEAEIATRLEAIIALETEVDALEAALSILAFGGHAPREAAKIEHPPETVAPDPDAILRQPPARAAKAPDSHGAPDPELVAIFNEHVRPDALRQIATERGQLITADAALALLHSSNTGKGVDYAACSKAISNTLTWTKSEWRNVERGVWELINPPTEHPPEPKPPTPPCPKCGGSFASRETSDNLGRREMVTECRQCGHAIPEPAAPVETF